MTQKRWTIAFAPAGEGEYQVTVRRSGAVHRFTTKLPPDISELWEKSASADTPNRSFRKSPEGVPNEAMFFQAANLPTLKEIGERVLNSVFDVSESIEGPKILGALEDRIADNEGVEIEIDLSQTAELSGIPWESLYLRSRDRFLAIGTTSNIVRRLDTQSEAPEAIERPIRILVAAANPHKDLDTGEELANIRKRIDCLVAEGEDDFEIRELPAATRDDFMREVNDWHPHVVHYIGHSSFRDGSGYLYFESPGDGESDAVSAETLRNMLLNRRPWLVVLNSCRSGETSREDPMGGVAQNLLQRLNIPFVVAMQQPVSDDAAIRFSQEFYTALTGGQKIADAVTMGRCAIANDRDERTQVELITPALYTSGDADRIAFVEAAAIAAMEQTHDPTTKSPLSTFLATGTGKIAATLVALPIALAAAYGVWSFVGSEDDGGDDPVLDQADVDPPVTNPTGTPPDDIDPNGNSDGQGGNGSTVTPIDGSTEVTGNEGRGANVGQAANQGNAPSAREVVPSSGTGQGSGGAYSARIVDRSAEIPDTGEDSSNYGAYRDTPVEPSQPQGYPATPSPPDVDPIESPPPTNVDQPPVAPLPPTPPPAPVCENPALIFFDWDSSVPPAMDAQQVVDFVAGNFEVCSWYELTVIGHADTSGPGAYNLRLSEARAKSVADMLRNAVPQVNVFVEYRGEDEPRVPTEDDIREPQNRRVEIRVQ